MEDAFRVVNTLSDALGPITCIRFSPDGNRMAGACLDGNVYIYSVLENFKLEVSGRRYSRFWGCRHGYSLKRCGAATRGRSTRACFRACS